MNATIRAQLDNRKRRIERRLNRSDLCGRERPVFTAANIHYEIADRARGLAHGGIGAIHVLARQIGLIDEIDRRLHLLKVHLPFHESDHVLNFAYNALCEGNCLQDIELRRNDEVFLDALGARRIPDPTTAGDFCRRFDEPDVRTLLDIFHEIRIRVWSRQDDAFFDCATIEMDGTLVETLGNCKEGMDIAYDGTWGYHPLVLTLAETNEILSIVNRSGNRPSYEGAADEVDRCLEVCFRGGFRRVELRGDSDYSQTQHLDRWDNTGRVGFVFGYPGAPNLKEMAEDLPADAWRKLHRREPPEPSSGQRRRRPDNVKDKIVRRRNFKRLELQSEDITEFPYRPRKCKKAYRMVVIRKHIAHERGQERLFEEYRYFFYFTNDWKSSAEEIVFAANDRCNQENVLAQLHGGCHALRASVNSLVSNWAYMAMTALAWNLKAWWALCLPAAPGRHQTIHRQQKERILRLEFKTFVQAFVEDVPVTVEMRGAPPG